MRLGTLCTLVAALAIGCTDSSQEETKKGNIPLHFEMNVLSEDTLVPERYRRLVTFPSPQEAKALLEKMVVSPAEGLPADVQRVIETRKHHTFSWEKNKGYDEANLPIDGTDIVKALGITEPVLHTGLMYSLGSTDGMVGFNFYMRDGTDAFRQLAHRLSPTLGRAMININVDADTSIVTWDDCFLIPGNPSIRAIDLWRIKGGMGVRFYFNKDPESGRITTAKSELEAFRRALTAYVSSEGEFPAPNTTGLLYGILKGGRESDAKVPTVPHKIRREGNMIDALLDVWGQPYNCKSDGSSAYAVRSAGPDRIPGTADDLTVECSK